VARDGNKPYRMRPSVSGDNVLPLRRTGRATKRLSTGRGSNTVPCTEALPEIPMKAILNVIVLGAAASMLAACSTRVTREVVHEQPIVQPQPVTVDRVTIVQPPPPPQETRPPPAPAGTGYTWVPGHYVWRDGSWQLESGEWRAGVIRPMPPMREEVPPPPSRSGARWVPGYWNLAGNDWVWVSGRWQ